MSSSDLSQDLKKEIKRIEKLIARAREGRTTHCIASLQRAILGLENAQADLQKKKRA